MPTSSPRLIAFVAATLLFTGSFGHAVGQAEEPTHTKDSLPTVKENVDEGKAVIVDVREPSEWEAGHLQVAISLPKSKLTVPAELAELIKKLPKDKIIYTHCAVGKRALDCGEILKQQGYTVRPLKPGYKQLIEAGFEKAK